MATDAQGNDLPTTDFYTLMALITRDHPDIAALLGKPGVLPVVLEMEDAEVKGQPWSQAQLQARLQTTQYYQQTTDQARNWDVLQATDPATAKTKATNTKAAIDDLMTQYGVQLDQTGGFNSLYFKFFQTATQEGWTPDQIKYHLLSSVNQTDTTGGELGNIGAQVKKTFDDYGVPISDQAVMDYARKVGSGAIDPTTVQGDAMQHAESLFPGLADGLARGQTVRTLASPYLQIAQQETGIDPTTVSLTDPKYMRALNSIDPKTGARVQMSLSDWTALVRSDPTYGYDKTPQAASQAADFATKIAQQFGATG